MAKRTTAKRKAELEAAEVPQVPPQIPVWMQDAELGKVIDAKITLQLQVQLEDGTWDLFGTPTSDQGRLQLTQDYRARKYPDERRRVIEHAQTWTVVDIEEPGRDPGPLPVTDEDVPETSQEIIGTMARRIKETRN